MPKKNTHTAEQLASSARFDEHKLLAVRDLADKAKTFRGFAKAFLAKHHSVQLPQCLPAPLADLPTNPRFSTILCRCGHLTIVTDPAGACCASASCMQRFPVAFTKYPARCHSCDAPFSAQCESCAFTFCTQVSNPDCTNPVTIEPHSHPYTRLCHQCRSAPSVPARCPTTPPPPPRPTTPPPAPARPPKHPRPQPVPPPQ